MKKAIGVAYKNKCAYYIPVQQFCVKLCKFCLTLM